MSATADDFARKVKELAEEHNVPGVAAGVLFDGVEHYGYAGVTSIENPLEVDEHTLFQFGSTGKTFTATALVRLAEQGKVDLDAPVRTYVPELTLKDEDVAARVTVLQLLNHTAGWDGDLMTDTGDGDDCIEKFVALLADIEQVTPLGETISYNNAALNLAGRVIEKVTGQPYAQAIHELLLKPLGLNDTFFTFAPLMTRRFAVGHNLPEGESTPRVARPWGLARSCAPAGSTATATARDQIAWAKFHLGDGTGADGTQVLGKQSLQRMKEPSAQLPAGALGDAIGISWMLQVVDGVITVKHGGTTNGQHSAFLMVPDRNFAIVSLTNCGPNGPQLNDALVKWALEEYLGVKEEEPQLASLDDAALEEYEGTYDTIAVTVTLTPKNGRLLASLDLKPEARAQLAEAGQDADEEQPPFVLALVEGKPDQYVVPEGAGKGLRGYFTRSADGRVDGVHLGGRLATRVAVTAGASAGAVLTEV